MTRIHVRRLLPGLLLFALLVPTLDAQSLWWDEGISLLLAKSTWAEVVADRASNIHPPLYFFLLKGWISLAGTSPFAARYLSALAAVLLPPAVYAFVRCRFDERSGRGAALLVALAPPFFIYGQEVRAYAFLPLLALVLAAQVWPPPGRAGVLHRGSGARLLLALTQAVLPLMHYTGVIAVGWANVALLIQALRSRDRRALLRWVGVVGLVGLLTLPWALALVAARGVGLSREAGMGNLLDEPVPFNYLVNLIAIFHAVGLPQALSDPLLWRVSLLAIGVVLISLLVWRWKVRGLSNAMHWLLLAWILPLLVVPIFWIRSPQSHPRYVLPFVLGGWLVAAVLATSRAIPLLLRLVLLGATLSVSLLGLRAYLVVPRYARSDVRAAAAFLREDARPGDVVFVPHTDASLLQYDLGAAQGVMLPRPSDGDGVAAMLSQATLAGHRVYLLDYGRDALDARGQVRATLAWNGWLLARHDFPGVFLQTYALDGPANLPSCESLSRTCVADGAPCLVGAAVEPHPESGAALPVVLCWEGGPGVGRYAVALRLYAESGALVGVMDDTLLSLSGRPTDLWAGGATTTYHLLPLPVGLLPTDYHLAVGLYDVEQISEPLSLVRSGEPPVPALPLGAVVPAVEPWLEPSPYSIAGAPRSLSARIDSGLQLEGAAIDREEAFPGQLVYATIRWRVLDALPGTSPRLVLRQGERDLADVALLSALPPLPVGRPLLEHTTLRVPPDAEDGPARVLLLHEEQAIPLGELALVVGDHRFAMPEVTHAVDRRAGDVGALVGFDLAPSSVVHSGDPVTVTLFWKAGQPARDLTVFVHLIGRDGNIVAQHDGKPEGGTRPTSGWIPGEYLVDSHTLSWREDYSGAAALHVGLYDAESGERVLWEENADTSVLPEELMVRPASE